MVIHVGERSMGLPSHTDSCSHSRSRATSSLAISTVHNRDQKAITVHLERLLLSPALQERKMIHKYSIFIKRRLAASDSHTEF